VFFVSGKFPLFSRYVASESIVVYCPNYYWSMFAILASAVFPTSCSVALF
jgi:hypothetical protein